MIDWLSDMRPLLPTTCSDLDNYTYGVFEHLILENMMDWHDSNNVMIKPAR
jgi:hypothetical protein